MSFKVGLARAMAKAGMSQTELAGRLKLSRPAIGQWLSGETEPVPRRLQQIAEALETTVSDLLSDEPVVGVQATEEASTAGKSRIIVRKHPPVFGEPLEDPDELELITFWRSLSIVKKAALFAHLGFDDMPSLRKSA